MRLVKVGEGWSDDWKADQLVRRLKAKKPKPDKEQEGSASSSDLTRSLLWCVEH